jgi:hypothetical protein
MRKSALCLALIIAASAPSVALAKSKAKPAPAPAPAAVDPNENGRKFVLNGLSQIFVPIQSIVTPKPAAPAAAPAPKKGKKVG